jgi:hypothetical protein
VLGFEQSGIAAPFVSDTKRLARFDLGEQPNCAPRARPGGNWMETSPLSETNLLINKGYFGAARGIRTPDPIITNDVLGTAMQPAMGSDDHSMIKIVWASLGTKYVKSLNHLPTWLVGPADR